MDYFTIELRHGESKQVWIACSETVEKAMELAREAPEALPNARAEAETLTSQPPFRLKPDTVKLWVP
ncbi:hypothetical protein [Pseudophaeobacter arcticus]|uniref:hypothetical protein n=1 Tax=Pseudophaeobacter arcticus TaxID=385492 RepID=UPI0024906D71|nr:hypothetical protein [Pseudophaeobacter arcticus]